MHTHEGDTLSAKPKVAKSKVSNQHQLAPTQNTGPSKQGNPQGQTRGGYKNNNNLGSRQGQNNDGYYSQNNFRDSAQSPVVEAHEAEVENHRTIIIQMIKAKILKGTVLKEEGVVIKIEARDVVTTHNKGSNKHIPKITSHLKAYTLIWLHHLCPHRI